MDALYDRTGRAVGSIDGSGVLRTLEGDAVGLTAGDEVYTLRGTHAGYREDGHFYDNRGDIVVFTEAAINDDPPKPALKATDSLSFSPVVVPTPMLALPMAHEAPTSMWAPLTFEGYLSQ